MDTFYVIWNDVHPTIKDVGKLQSQKVNDEILFVLI